MSWLLVQEEKPYLESPGGERIAFPYRKVAELCLLLSQSPNRPLSKPLLGERLWPMASSAQRAQNLRQALHHLRGVLGSDSVAVSPTGCRLKQDLVRLNEQPEQARESELNAFGSFLEYASNRNPAATLETLALHADMALDLPHGRLETLLARIQAVTLTDRQRGWAHYFLGHGCVGALPRAVRHFDRARIFGHTAADQKLSELSTYWLGSSHILLGNLSRARELVAYRVSQPAPQGMTQSVASVTLEATVHLHSGQFLQAVQTMSEARDRLQLSASEFEHFEALRAVYLASIGLHDQALDVLAVTPRNSADDPVSRAESLRACAQSFNDAEREPHHLLGWLPRHLKCLAAAKSHQFEMYGFEALSIAHRKLGHRQEAASALKQVQNLRRDLGVIPTAWDRYRLQSLYS